MFTGLVETKNTLLASETMEAGVKLTFSHSFEGVELGESIAINGACLTVVSFDEKEAAFELSNETLELTSLGALSIGDEVNMERALRAGDRLGGHMVTGHVDGLGTIKRISPEGEMTRVSVEVPETLKGYVARKGSLTVDGVSLTVNDVEDNLAHLLIIPHTQEVTTLGARSEGDRVNLEVDLVARYVARLLETRGQ